MSLCDWGCARVCVCVCLWPEGLNDHFKPPPSTSFHPPRCLALLWLHILRWPLVPCAVLVWDCIRVCARTRRRPPKPRVPNCTMCVWACVFTLIPLAEVCVCQVLCCFPRSLFLFFFCFFFFLCVYRCENEELKTSSWRLYLFVPLQLFLSLVFAAEINEEGEGGGQNPIGF